MRGNMMQFPLTLTAILERAGSLFSGVEIISRLPHDGGAKFHRYAYADFCRRARALCGALLRAGVQPGDRIATLMWNHHIHLECYFGIPASGAVMHTLNLRLHPDELAYIVNHAEDRFLIVDEVLLPTLAAFRDRIHPERVIIVRPSGNAGDGENYDGFCAGGESYCRYVAVEEDDAAALCYTSGTTGQPKGVLYSHRALALHSLGMALADCFAISRQDTVLPAMSMFHANAWGVPFCAVMMGSRLVLPHRYLDCESLLDLLSREQVTFSGAVPTVWLAVAEALERHSGRWKLAPNLRVAIAGSACPESLLRRLDGQGIHAMQPWGMTETSPIATIAHLTPEMRRLSSDQQYAIRATQGTPLPFVELRAENENGAIPWNGETFGELQVRGPWIAQRYFKRPDENEKWTEDGWLRTGDVVAITPEGFIRIVDRSKDLIKSGGEWISSVDVENAIVGHPAIREAAVIAVPHPRWAERPLAIVVLKDGVQLDPDELRQYLLKRFAKWQLPDEFVTVSELPHTSTGKLLKTELRRRFANWQWNTATAGE
jgi:fatty-acyl-CoA synthase